MAKRGVVIGSESAAQSLREQGYEVEERNESMSDRAILSALLTLIQHAQKGDDVAFVFCGKGTQWPAEPNVRTQHAKPPIRKRAKKPALP